MVDAYAKNRKVGAFRRDGIEIFDHEVTPAFSKCSHLAVFRLVSHRIVDQFPKLTGDIEDMMTTGFFSKKYKSV